MKISVVLTTLNEEENVEEFLESVRQQTKDPYQIILVDGGSTDRTIEKVERSELDIEVYADDGDLGSSRNLGTRKADGEIVAFTNVDGRLDSHWMEEIEKGFREFPEAAGIQGKIIDCFTEKVPDFFEKREEGEKITFTDGGNMAFRKQELERRGGFDSNRFCGWEDMDIGYRVSRTADIRYWPGALYREKPNENDFQFSVRCGIYWSRFIIKHRKPGWISKVYANAFKNILRGDLILGFKELAGVTCGIGMDLSSKLKNLS